MFLPRPLPTPFRFRNFVVLCSLVPTNRTRSFEEDSVSETMILVDMPEQAVPAESVEMLRQELRGDCGRILGEHHSFSLDVIDTPREDATVCCRLQLVPSLKEHELAEAIKARVRSVLPEAKVSVKNEAGSQLLRMAA